MKRTGLTIALFLLSLSGLWAFEPSDVYYDECKEIGYSHADCSGFNAAGAGEAKNVILMIGDGMGINQIYSGRVYLNGPDKPLNWETLPHRGLVTTCSIGEVTDSAASATAMATGHKTSNGVISMKDDGSYEKVPNILDMVHDKKAVGVVTTTEVWDATPAAFVSHALSRNMDREIARQMTTESLPEVIMGGGRAAFEPLPLGGEKARFDSVAAAEGNGYKVVRTREELLGLDASSTTRLLGLFAHQKLRYEANRSPESYEPHLSEMSKAALDVLANDPRGFFLMIEGARIDHSSHRVDVDKLVGEVVEFDKTVNMVMEWMESHPDTLLIITADHECGGIEVQPGDYKKGDYIRVSWSSMVTIGYAYHSSQRVPIFAKGPNAGAIKEHMDDTEIMCVIKNAFDGKYVEKKPVDSSFPYVMQ